MRTNRNDGTSWLRRLPIGPYRANRCFAAVPLLTAAVAAALLSGCLSNSSKAERAAERAQICAPTNLIHQVATADRLVVSMIPRRGIPESWLFEFEEEGPEARRVVHAISKVKGYRFSRTDTAYAFKLEFYKGTNCLASVDYMKSGIVCSEGEYLDQTGELEKLYRRILAETPLGRR